MGKNELESFILSVARPRPPLPGGGSVAALAGALAAALGEMMSSLTEGRPEYAPVDARVREIHSRLTEFRSALQDLMVEDETAFRALMDALRLPKETEAQRCARNEILEKATRKAIETPLRNARAACEVLECMEFLVEVGNPNARADAAVGAQLAYTSLKGAQYSILANIPGTRDKAFAENCRAEVGDLVRRGQAILQNVDGIMIS